MAWIAYQKAFDRVPHSWIIKSLELIGINNKVISFTKNVGLRIEERPPLWRVAVNKLNKQPRKTDEGWSSSLGVGRGANNPSP